MNNLVNRKIQSNYVQFMFSESDQLPVLAIHA